MIKNCKLGFFRGKKSHIAQKIRIFYKKHPVFIKNASKNSKKCKKMITMFVKIRIQIAKKIVFES